MLQWQRGKDAIEAASAEIVTELQGHAACLQAPAQGGRPQPPSGKTAMLLGS